MKSCKECVHALIGKIMFCICPAPGWVNYSDHVGAPCNIIKETDARECPTYQPREEQS